MITFFKITEDKEIWMNFREKSVCIQNCQQLSKKEIKPVIQFCIDTLKSLGYAHTANIKHMCGELYFHVVLAKLGILTSHTKNADIEYNKDPRWYVRLFSNIFGILFK